MKGVEGGAKAKAKRASRASRAHKPAAKAKQAVKWNSPFYGIGGQGWFLSFHVFTRYIKVTFFSGTSLRPLPTGASKHKHVRYFDIREGDKLDEAQMASWVKQAAALPGFLAP